MKPAGWRFAARDLPFFTLGESMNKAVVMGLWIGASESLDRAADQMGAIDVDQVAAHYTGKQMARAALACLRALWLLRGDVPAEVIQELHKAAGRLAFATAGKEPMPEATGERRGL